MSYHKNSNWEYVTESDEADNDEATELNASVLTDITSPKNSSSVMDMYDLEEEDVSQVDTPSEIDDLDDFLISSGVVEGDVSSLESECTFVSSARLMPHSSTVSLLTPPTNDVTVPELLDIPSHKCFQSEPAPTLEYSEHPSFRGEWAYLNRLTRLCGERETHPLPPFSDFSLKAQGRKPQPDG